MPGYYGFSMSNNAVDAYASGEMPLSKWTKQNILNAVERAIATGDLELSVGLSDLSRLPLKELKKIALIYTSWHHTSKHFNRTDFYSLDLDELQSLSPERIDEVIEKSKKEKKTKVKPKDFRALCKYLEWSGTRAHPKAVECVREGVIKGNWFYLPDGTRKSVNANGFVVLEKSEVTER